MRLPPPPDGMLKITASILGVLLGVSILIMWVPGLYVNPTFFQAGLFLMAAVWGIRMGYRPYAVAGSFLLLPLTVAACWGLLQLAMHTTVSRWETAQAVRIWAGNLTAFFFALQVCQSTSLRRRLLDGLAIFAFAISVVSILQYFSKPDLLLWFYYDGFGNSFGPFASRDRYAAFAELVIPLALLWALKQETGRKTLFYTGIAATIFAAAIAGASRAGGILCVAEVIVFLVAGRNQRSLDQGRLRITAGKFALFASIFTVVVGYSALLQRFHDPDPYAGRREMLRASVTMVQERPWFGFGLGNFENAYPKYAVLDVNKIVNHAHNDWAEWAAEGGVPFFVIVLSVAVWAVPRALRSLWGIGIVTVFVHSLVDFPLQAPALEFWVFAFLGALAAESGSISPATSGHRSIC